jgi:hypothetical protein
MLNTRLELQINKKRTTHQEQKPSSITNLKKTKKALIPNIIHSTDSEFAKIIIKKYNIKIVHDEFEIDIINVGLCIDDINYTYHKYIINENIPIKINLDTYSFFIIL